MSERTFVMIKPDGVGRRLIGDCVQRLEKRGLKLVAVKMRILSREMAERHYGEHEGKPYYEPLLAFITSGPVVLMVWEGVDAIAQVRKMIGATNAFQADPGTIRGDWAMSNRFNLIHASDAPDTARREMAIYFDEDELVTYSMPDEHWLK